MGLLFALQPEMADSTPKRLHLTSHLRKMAVGLSFIFSGVFVGVMTLATAPLFKVMLVEGNFFDKIVVYFFASVLVVYPLLAGLCFTFEEHLILEQKPNKLFDITGYKKILFLRWNQFQVQNVALEELKEENWVGALNSAALKAKKAGTPNRYATKGHWMLILEKDNKKYTLEKRAKKEEISWLKYLIEKHFSASVNEAQI
jgi:hypothetical protein